MVDPSKILNLDVDRFINSKVITESIKQKEVVLKSGSNNFDKVLGGGFRSGKNYLVFGANKTGKTQLCHQLCVESFKQFSDDYILYYLDSENTFRPERLVQLATIQSLDNKEIINKILVSKIVSNTALSLTLNNIEDRLDKSQEKVLILLIDSINNHYRAEVGNKAISFSETKKTFLNSLEKLNTLTKDFNLITIATAQITPNFTENALIREIPVGNQFLNHYFSESVYLSYKEEDKSYIHVVNSCSNPEKKVLYQITSKGIEDYIF